MCKLQSPACAEDNEAEDVHISERAWAPDKDGHIDSSQHAAQAAALGECLSVFLFDWDDTLFPTTALSAMGPEPLRSTFAVLDKLIVQLLRVALSMPRSRVVLLTNANPDWVRRAADDFLPEAAQLFHALPASMSIVSAQRKVDDNGERLVPGTPAYVTDAMTWSTTWVKFVAAHGKPAQRVSEASECDLAWSQYLEVEKGLRELQEALQGFLDNWLSGWGSVTLVAQTLSSVCDQDITSRSSESHVTKKLAEILTALASERAAFGKAFQEQVIAYMVQEFAPFSALNDLAVARERALLNCKHYDEKMSSIGGATAAGGVRATVEGDSSTTTSVVAARAARVSRNRDKMEKAHDEILRTYSSSNLGSLLPSSHLSRRSLEERGSFVADQLLAGVESEPIKILSGRKINFDTHPSAMTPDNGAVKLNRRSTATW